MRTITYSKIGVVEVLLARKGETSKERHRIW
jgi:hypothetical protein